MGDGCARQRNVAEGKEGQHILVLGIYTQLQGRGYTQIREVGIILFKSLNVGPLSTWALQLHEGHCAQRISARKKFVPKWRAGAPWSPVKTLQAGELMPFRASWSEALSPNHPNTNVDLNYLRKWVQIVIFLSTQQREHTHTYLTLW